MSKKRLLLALPLLVACLFSCADKQASIVEDQVKEPEPLPVQIAAETPAQVLPSPPQTDESVVTKPVIVAPVKVVITKAAAKKADPVVTAPAKPEIQKAVPDKMPVTDKPVIESPPEEVVPPTVSVQPEKPVQVVAEPAPVMPVLGSVKGTVTILGQNSEQLPAGEVIVTLEPLFPVPAVNHPQKTYEISMVDKKYTPAVITIKTGDTVKFHNKDTIKHNVFSSSGDNAFELGTYGLDVAEGATFKHPGIVKVYCNIHANMAAFVSVSDAGYSFVTKDNGEFFFNDLPVGEYRLKVWHVRGEATKNVQIRANQNAIGDVVINSASYVPETHLNKYGKAYTTTPTLFKDEFY